MYNVRNVNSGNEGEGHIRNITILLGVAEIVTTIILIHY